MRNNYPTKHDAWGVGGWGGGGNLYAAFLIKFTSVQQKKQAGNIKAVLQDTAVNLKLFFIVLLPVILGKCSSLIRNLILRIFDNGVLKYL